MLMVIILYLSLVTTGDQDPLKLTAKMEAWWKYARWLVICSIVLTTVGCFYFFFSLIDLTAIKVQYHFPNMPEYDCTHEYRTSL